MEKSLNLAAQELGSALGPNLKEERPLVFCAHALRARLKPNPTDRNRPLVFGLSAQNRRKSSRIFLKKVLQ